MTEPTLSAEDIATINAKIEAQSQQKAIEKLVKTRQALISSKIVITTSGKKFDANEISISRLCNAIIRNLNNPDTHIIPWSTADVGTGVMVDCTKAEIVEAHQLATDFFGEVWGA